MPKIYETEITNTGGRSGEVYSEDKSFFHKVSSPGSGIKDTTNPEQLFAAGYSACFNGALEVAMKNAKNVHKSIVKVKVALNNDAKLGFFIDVVIQVHIDDIDLVTAKKLVEDADQICPYSKALRNNVKVELKVI
ncbi:Ohr family peroxiredoxin [Mesoplasma photuris]|uniref:Ohr family peroxiredoxin n=1 Tax=Mesoplasma photuris TaxID=217731 RepID=UPI0004E1607D|nr:Ohr family peroxiredoxin [Mesoplasma photuris]